MRMELVSHSESETVALGERIGRLLRAGDVVTLIGELGAGKTRFVRGVAQGLSIDPAVVNSPTYVLVNEYEPEQPQAPALVHVDAYRLSGGSDLSSLGWSDVRDEGAVVVIEWADRVASEIPADALTIRIEHDEHEESTTRRLTISGDDQWRLRLQPLGSGDD